MKKTYRYAIGIVMGFFIFVVSIPCLIVFIAKGFDSLLHIKLINNQYLQTIVAIPLYTIGLALQIWANISLYKIGKGGPLEGVGIAVSPPTEKLVTTGPYKYTRNPIMFGNFLSYIALVIFLDSVMTLIVVALFFIHTVCYLKSDEEKRLLRDFGEEFIEYKKRTPMVIPYRRRQM